jgi:hypothetical protein
LLGKSHLILTPPQFLKDSQVSESAGVDTHVLEALQGRVTVLTHPTHLGCCQQQQQRRQQRLLLHQRPLLLLPGQIGSGGVDSTPHAAAAAAAAAAAQQYQAAPGHVGLSNGLQRVRLQLQQLLLHRLGF